VQIAESTRTRYRSRSSLAWSAVEANSRSSHTSCRRHRALPSALCADGIARIGNVHGLRSEGERSRVGRRMARAIPSERPTRYRREDHRFGIAGQAPTRSVRPNSAQLLRSYSRLRAPLIRPQTIHGQRGTEYSSRGPKRWQLVRRAVFSRRKLSTRRG
jgi:hypothetical protein